MGATASALFAVVAVVVAVSGVAVNVVGSFGCVRDDVVDEDDAVVEGSNLAQGSGS